jgi:hypothetical protein
MNLLLSIFHLAVPLLVLALFLWESRKPARARFDGTLMLSHGTFIWTLGIISGFVVPLCIAIIGLIAGMGDPKDPYYFLALVALFGGMGALLLLEAYRNWVILSPFGIEQHTFWGRSKQFAWSQITAVDYSPQSGNFILHSHSGEKIRVNTYLRGIPSFLQFMCDHLPEEMYHQALRKAGRKPPVPNGQG